jgi:hypothetical protein
MTSDPDPAADAASGDPTTDAPAVNERWPLGFMLTIVMVSLYVGYRLVQLTVKFFQWVF